MRLNPIYAILFLLLLTVCSKEEEVAPTLSDLPSCLEDRATVKVVQNEKGILKDEAGLLLIEVVNSNESLAPCNLPSTFQENDQVLFSGNKKEILPNERWAGHPFELTSIKKQGEGTVK